MFEKPTDCLNCAKTRKVFLGVLVFALFGGVVPGTPSLWAQGLKFAGVSDNQRQYPEGAIPRYERLEISFQVENTVAENLQLPFDPDPPPGVDPGVGISVDAQLTPDGWKTVYQVPAFLYQGFLHDVRGQREWIYPTENFSWKVRFAPHRTGTWHYRLTARDRSGAAQSAVYSFEVSSSTNRGFIRVSQRDTRYFEFEDGTYFPALGYNYHPFNLNNPLLGQREHFRIMGENGIQLIRVWIGSLYGSAWNPYVGGRGQYRGYLPVSGLLPFRDDVSGKTTLTMLIDYEPAGDTGWFDACRFEAQNDPEAVKLGTLYRVRVQYRGLNITGPRSGNFSDYGLVVKLGGWHPDCYEAGSGTPVTNYGRNNSTWDYIEGTWYSGDNNYLPRFHLGLENVKQGQVYVQSISVREVLGGGAYGPEILVKPSMEHHLYIPQEKSFVLDRIIDLAKERGVYLKVVIMEKDDKIYFKMEDDGRFVTGQDNQHGFYGVGRQVNKARWLQQVWWRYLQARWGYSAQIHSWELTNEGDPHLRKHYELADELGKYMHCRVFGIEPGGGDGKKCTYDHPNDHLVSTSTWHSFPKSAFWTNEKYPNVDYADIHRYVSRGKETQLGVDGSQMTIATPEDYFDAASVTGKLSDLVASLKVGKPVLRGETGFVTGFSGPPDRQIQQDKKAVWLHNFIWGGIKAGGLIESYWYDTDHIYGRRRNADPGSREPGSGRDDSAFDHRSHFGTYYRFIKDIPLSNGHYRDAGATSSHPELRVWGQKDLLHSQAHLWIQNKRHTWKNALDADVPLLPITATVAVPGFSPGTALVVEWWETWAGTVSRSEVIQTDRFGTAHMTVHNLRDDVALKVSPRFESNSKTKE